MEIIYDETDSLESKCARLEAIFKVLQRDLPEPEKKETKECEHEFGNNFRGGVGLPSENKCIKCKEWFPYHPSPAPEKTLAERIDKIYFKGHWKNSWELYTALRNELVSDQKEE